MFHLSEYKAFTRTAKKNRGDYTFGYVANEELIRTLSLTTKTITMTKVNEESPVLSEGTKNAKKITEWLKENALPIFGEISPSNYMSYIERGLPIVFAFMNPEEDNTEVEKEFLGVAKSLVGKYSVVSVDSIRFIGQAKRLGLSGDVVPCIAFEADEQHFAYSETAELTTESMLAWFKKHEDGELKPTIKSQPIPETQEEVYTIVADNFKEIVLDETKGWLSILMLFFDCSTVLTL